MQDAFDLLKVNMASLQTLVQNIWQIIALYHELADGVALPLPLVEGLNLGVALLKR